MKPEFDNLVEQHQLAWRAASALTKVRGSHKGVERGWILPEESWEEGLWPGVRSGSDHPVQAYLDTHGASRHTGANNLKSSWSLCANLYFPFGADRNGKELLAGFLKEHCAPEVQSVESVELEYALEGDLHPSCLLGEAGGSRGKGQTSPDAAFVVNGGRGLILTECKFTEHSFYECSARTTAGSDRRPGNPDPSRCLNAVAVLDSPATQCHQAAWGRKYFERLATAANRAVWASLIGCPAAFAGYQLFRQQALAEGIASSGAYDLVVSSVAVDARNDVLAKSLSSTGVSSIAEWGRLFQGRARFAVFTHQQWFKWVREQQDGPWSAWCTWVGNRYGFE